MPQSEPTVRSRLIGKELRRLREEAGLTLDEAGAFLDRSGSSVSRYENGYHSIRPIELRNMLDVYRVNDSDVRESLLSLARQGRQKGWWRNYKDRLSSTALDYASLEADATCIQSFETVVIPGLLQTERYARKVLEVGAAWNVHQGIEGLLTFRLARQQVLQQSDPPFLSSIIDESSLRRLVGSRELMYQQYGKLLAESQRDNISIRVLPQSVGVHPGVDGSFTKIDIGEKVFLRVVLIESLARSWYLEDCEDVDRYGLAFNLLHEVTLDEADSRSFIKDLSSKL